MQRLFLAISFLALSSATRTSPQQGKIDQAAPVQLRTVYDRLIKAAAQVEKLTGDASLLSKGKQSKATAEALVQDPQKVTNDAAKLATQAYEVLGSKPPASNTKQTEEFAFRLAYHEILNAAQGVELVRRKATTLSPEKVTAFAAAVNPDEVEKDVSKLKEDMNKAEDEAKAVKKELKEAEKKEEVTDDKDDTTEAAAANKAAKQALAEADHEQHGGDELVGKAEGDKKQQEEAAVKKADAKKEVETATAEHKAADAEHEKADDHDDKHEDKVEKLEKKLDKAEEKHEEAVEAHNEHPDTEEHEKVELKKEKKEKSGVQQIASCTAVLALVIFH